jgi:hypothetical protein
MGQRFFTETVSAVVENLSADVEGGLTALGACDGANKLAEATPLPCWRALVEQ